MLHPEGVRGADGLAEMVQGYRASIPDISITSTTSSPRAIRRHAVHDPRPPRHRPRRRVHRSHDQPLPRRQDRGGVGDRRRHDPAGPDRPTPRAQHRLSCADSAGPAGSRACPTHRPRVNKRSTPARKAEPPRGRAALLPRTSGGTPPASQSLPIGGPSTLCARSAALRRTGSRRPAQIGSPPCPCDRGAAARRKCARHRAPAKRAASPSSHDGGRIPMP